MIEMRGRQEEVQDWASHLEHLQAILIEFDADGALEESHLIRFFREGIKPSVKAQMEQRGLELDSWDKLVEKAIDAEAKASLQPVSIFHEMDQRCPRDDRPAHTGLTKSPAQAIGTWILEMSRTLPFNRVRLKIQTLCNVLRDSRMLAKPPARNLGGKRRSNTAKTRSGVGTQGLRLLPVGLRQRTLVTSPVSTVTGKVTMRISVLNP